MVQLMIGNDYVGDWHIVVNRGQTDIASLDITLELTDPFGRKCNIEYWAEGEHVLFKHYGVDQHKVGKYTLKLWVNKGKSGQACADIVGAIELVPHSTPCNFHDGNITLLPSFDLGTINLAFGIKGDKGDKGDSADTSALEARLQAQELVNKAQQTQIDKNQEETEQIKQTIPTEDADGNGIPDGEDRLNRIEESLGEEASEEDIEAMFS